MARRGGNTGDNATCFVLDAVHRRRKPVLLVTGIRLHAQQSAAPNIEARNNDTWGVLKLTPEPGGYAWEFIPVAGGSFIDSGRGTCH